MEQTETLRLLRQLDERMQQMEARQRAQRRQQLLVLGVACTLLAALALWVCLGVIPQVRTVMDQYNTTVKQVQQLGQKLTELDLDVVSRTLTELDGVDLSALEDAAQNLQQLDLSALEESFDFLQKVDLEKLSGQVDQLQDVLKSLEGLDAQALNTAVKNLNRALEPILGLFD